MMGGLTQKSRKLITGTSLGETTMAKQPMGESINRWTEDDGLKGVRGWLLFACVVLGLSVFVQLIYIISSFVSNQSGASAEIIIGLPLAILAAYCVHTIWEEK